MSAGTWDDRPQRRARAPIAALFSSPPKKAEHGLAAYGAELDRRQALGDAQVQAHQAFTLAQGQVAGGSVSALDLLTSEQQLVASDAAVAGSDAALVQDQEAVFKALGGGWQLGPRPPAER